MRWSFQTVSDTCTKEVVVKSKRSTGLLTLQLIVLTSYHHNCSFYIHTLLARMWLNNKEIAQYSGCSIDLF